MNDPQEGIEFEYFYTAGGGLETFVASEILIHGSSTIQLITSGKVCFSSSLSPDELLSVKTAERLFILIHREPQFLLNRSKRDAITHFRAIVEGESAKKWQRCLNKWKEFYRILRTDECSEALKFRVSCKSSGKVKHAFPSFFLGKIMAGSLLNMHPKWIPELRCPKLEVLVHADGDMLTVGIACCLFNEPLSKRSYLSGIPGQVVLRPTLCAAMLGLAFKNVPNSVNDPIILLDPMCGSGMILAEAIACGDTSERLILLGSDADTSQISKAAKTIIKAEEMRITRRKSTPARGSKPYLSQLFLADARALPLPNNSVHCIVSDLPFGLKHTCKPWPLHLKNILRRDMNVVSDVETSASTSTQDTSSSNVEKCLDIDMKREIHRTPRKVDDQPDENASQEIDAIMSDVRPCNHLKGLKRKYSNGEETNVYGTDKTSEIVDTIEDARNMFPQIILEMDRVLVKGGRVVLIISEKLKACLLESVCWVTSSHIPTECCSPNQQLSLGAKCTSACQSHHSDSISRPKNITLEKEDTDLLKSKRKGWLCVDEYRVKLGVLDAVICVFDT
ncbi:THUMP domain-containing protein 2-like [Ischnura elegans]|uniref:THUMP domain-containing protein 2-like n=1 Tax=Ischnura elegans TaxID=197161 RepID=UPI001ED8B78B|nr:THUMP domain-containing protein 2-like [Ischnura elegans]